MVTYIVQEISYQQVNVSIFLFPRINFLLESKWIQDKTMPDSVHHFSMVENFWFNKFWTDLVEKLPMRHHLMLLFSNLLEIAPTCNLLARFWGPYRVPCSNSLLSHSQIPFKTEHEKSPFSSHLLKIFGDTAVMAWGIWKMGTSYSDPFSCLVISCGWRFADVLFPKMLILAICCDWFLNRWAAIFLG